METNAVKVYYCKCGRSIMCAGSPEFIEKDRASKKEFKQAEEWGRKVETITLEEYRKIPFMCVGVPECPKTKDTTAKTQ